MSVVQTLPASYYDRDYYYGVGGKSHYRGYDWATFGDLFTALAHFLVTTAFPGVRSVLDVGCATGLLVRALRTLEVDAWGVEHSDWCIEQADPLAKPYLYHQSLDALSLDRAFTVITACETLEHLAPIQLQAALPRLRKYARVGLFATIPTPDMSNKTAWQAAAREPSHVTLEPRGWWYEQFAAAGFVTSPIHRLAEQYCHMHPLVGQMGWNVFLLGV